MNFPPTHPLWMWLCFGLFGSADVILFTLIAWTWTKLHAHASRGLRTAARWGIVGLMFLFSAAWFACGIGGPPGNTLSADPSVHNPSAALGAAALSMFFTLPGWACLLVGLTKMQNAVAYQIASQSP